MSNVPCKLLHYDIIKDNSKFYLHGSIDMERRFSKFGRNKKKISCHLMTPETVYLFGDASP
jgi:hypothetical protein